MEYLKNEICKFTPLFDIDYSKKHNIMSACFFKMKNSGYKDFSKYINGLNTLNNIISKLNLNYKLRLFIDNSIYTDKKIFETISKYKNVQMVLYSCPNYKIEDNYHIGLFGTLVRFFPMFNFPNNDANIVVSSDIDSTNIKIIVYYLKKLEKEYKNIFDNIYMFKSGPLDRSFRYKYNIFYKNKLNTYVWALSFASIKRIDKNVIVDYLANINNLNIEDISYHKSVNEFEESKYSKSYKHFIYGIDEHFLNDVLSKYLIDNNLCYIVNTSWTIYGTLYNILKNKYLTNKENELINLVFTYLNNKTSFNLELNDNMDINEKINVIDKIMYSKKTDEKKKYEINKLLYKMLLYFKLNKNYKFLFPYNLYKLFVDNDFFGIYEIDILNIVNCYNKDRNIILNKKKFNNDDIIKFKYFYKKYLNKQSENKN